VEQETKLGLTLRWIHTVKTHQGFFRYVPGCWKPEYNRW